MQADPLCMANVTRGIQKTVISACRDREVQKATRADQQPPARLLEVLVGDVDELCAEKSQQVSSGREQQHGGERCSQPCKVAQTISSRQHSAGKALKTSKPLTGPTLPWAPLQPSVARLRTHSSKISSHIQQGRKQQVISLLGKRPVSSGQTHAAPCAAAPLFNHYDDGRGSWVCPISMISRCCVQHQYMNNEWHMEAWRRWMMHNAPRRNQRRSAWRAVLTELNGSAWVSVTVAKICTTRGLAL